MNKLLLSALLAAGLLASARTADAGDCRRVFAGYDRCGRPVYQTIYVGRPVYDRCDPRPTYYRSYPTYHRGYPSHYRGYDSGYRTYYRSSSRSCSPRFGVSFSFSR
jgi:hypothetical protein